MIELIVYPKGKDLKLINNSPFCAKTEILLRLAKIEHKIVNFRGNPGKFKNAKLPVIKHNDKVIADSSFIQDYIEKEFKLDLNSHLSKEEKAQGFAFAKMMEEYLYWSLLHERWFIEENWINLRDSYFSHIPNIIRGIVTGIIRKKTKKSAIGHGMSRHSDEEVIELGRKSIRALSNFLATKDFILGDKVTLYDTTAYAFVASLLHSTLGPKLKAEALVHSNLVEYDKRMYHLLN